MLQWLLDRGEDPAEVAPRSCTFSMDKYYTRAKEETKIVLHAKDQSAVSYLLMGKRLMAQLAADAKRSDGSRDRRRVISASAPHDTLAAANAL